MIAPLALALALVPRAAAEEPPRPVLQGSFSVDAADLFDSRPASHPSRARAAHDGQRASSVVAPPARLRRPVCAPIVGSALPDPGKAAHEALAGTDDRRPADMTGRAVTHRLARRDDQDALRALIEAAISELQRGFLDEGQIASSRTIMGLDTQLIDDGTYFVVEIEGDPAGCGGWSRRATLYGGDQSPGRSAALLDPTLDPARIRAMYTHPRHARKGVGRLILALCEDAARAEGFRRVELMATLAGEPLYRACGYEPHERVMDDRGGTAVPLLRMSKAL